MIRFAQEDVRRRTADKLAVVSVSPFFKAILGWMVGEKWTSPAIEDIAVTVDGYFTIKEEGHLGFDRFGGNVGDLVRNVQGVAEVAELDEREWNYLLSRIPTFGETSEAPSLGELGIEEW